MNIIRAFDYKPLDRVAGPNGRMYQIVGEPEPLPSVTTILSNTKDTTHLQAWVERVGEAEAERIKNEASTLGAAMHQNLENYIIGKPQAGNHMARALANLIVRKGLSKVDEVWGVEVALYSSRLYAGTTDLVGVHQGDAAIMDFKNTLNPKKREWIEDYFMQLAAYAMSHNEMFGTNISKGVIMMATRAGEYQEFIIEKDEFLYYETLWAEKVYAYYDKYKKIEV